MDVEVISPVLMSSGEPSGAAYTCVEEVHKTVVYILYEPALEICELRGFFKWTLYINLHCV